MSKLLELAQTHRNYGLLIRDRAVKESRSIWSRLFNPRNPEASFWDEVHPRLMDVVSESQRLSASLADDYLNRTTGVDPVGELRPDAFAGVAADGRPLESLLAVPLDRATDPESDDDGQDTLERIVASETADAGRTADQVALVSRPEVTGYVRVLELPSCAACVILAGQTYRWNKGFERHPGCDCRHVPITDSVPDDVTTDPSAAVRSGMVHGISQDDRRAILEGADPAQVINARRRRYKTAGGESATTEGANGTTRLRPESIYQLAGDDRAEAIRLLRTHRYIA